MRVTLLVKSVLDFLTNPYFATSLHTIFYSIEIQKKLETEKGVRQRAEQKLLETEKKKSELSVDLGQLQSQSQTLRQDLKMEIEKVSTMSCAQN